MIKLSRKRPVALQGPPPEKDHKGRYHVQQWPYDEIIVPCADGEALAAAQTAIIEAGLDGIPVVLSSTLPWVDDTADTKTPTTSTTARRKPRRDDVLCRTMSSHWRSELRDNWSKLPDEFPPSDRDVWVTIRDYQMLDAERRAHRFDKLDAIALLTQSVADLRDYTRHLGVIGAAHIHGGRDVLVGVIESARSS